MVSGLIGVLGGLIGLGGAESRLPVLVGVYKFRTLQVIVINLVVSLVTVVFSFIFRAGLVNLDRIAAHAPIILNILAGPLLGSYLDVRFATRINEHTLTRVVVVFLVLLSVVLIGHDFIFQAQGRESTQSQRGSLLKISPGSKPTARAISRNSITSNRRSPRSYFET